MERTIIEAIARALFVDAYAYHCDECEGCDLFGHTGGHPQPGGGEDWLDFAPETPREFVDAAHRFVGALEQANRTNLPALTYFAAKADGMDPYVDGFEFPGGYAEEFGHYLGMMHLGHGVSWFDDHAEFEIKVPYGETVLL